MPPVVVVLIPYIFGTIGLLVWGRIADHNLWKAMINGKVLLLAVNYFGIVTAEPRHALFHPADHQVARQFHQHGGRLAHHDSLYLRRYRHGGVGSSLRRHERAALEPARGLCALDRRASCSPDTRWARGGHWSECRWPPSGSTVPRGRSSPMPPMFLSGTALAGAGFAWINSIGNLGGTVGPYYVGYMRDLTGNFAGGLYGLALLSLIAAVVCAFFLHIPQPGRLEAPQAATPHPA